MISREDVQKLAELSRIELTPEEELTFVSEIDSILGYVGQISEMKELGTDNAISKVRNVFRRDENPHESGLYTKALLEQAPSRDGDYLKVKKILQND
jgi:aspartyl-tRNA(Asn)/glutamyl-tRNA(Gln) amidotransferase subunit C